MVPQKCRDCDNREFKKSFKQVSSFLSYPDQGYAKIGLLNLHVNQCFAAHDWSKAQFVIRYEHRIRILETSDIKEGTDNWAWESPFARAMCVSSTEVSACWIRCKLRLFTSLITLAVCFCSVNLLVDSFLHDLYIPFGISLNLCC